MQRLVWNDPESVVNSKPVPYAAVLGLHDSGASEVRVALQHLGVQMGDEPGGFRCNGGGEDRQLAELCERAMPFPAPSLAIQKPELEDRFSAYLGHLTWRATKQSQIAGGKYPHLCAFGPMLKHWCGEQLRVIHVERPIEDATAALTRRTTVAGGLEITAEQQAKRVQIELESKKHNFLRTKPHLTIHYADLRESPETQLRRLVTFLTMPITGDAFESAVKYLKSCRW